MTFFFTELWRGSERVMVQGRGETGGVGIEAGGEIDSPSLRTRRWIEVARAGRPSALSLCTEVRGAHTQTVMPAS
jgi:hypothetical protein